MDNTNQSIIRVSSEIKVCEKCRDKVVPIVYGYPSPETFKKAERGEIKLGGCCIDVPFEELEDLVCVKCGQRYKVMDMNEKEISSGIVKLFEKLGIEGKVVIMEPTVSGSENRSDYYLLVILYQHEVSSNEKKSIQRQLDKLVVETGNTISANIVSLNEWEKLIADSSPYAELDNFKEIIYEMVGSRKGLDEAMEDVRNGNLSSYNSVDEMIKDILNKPEEE